MKMLLVTNWGWSEMLGVALISICLVFFVLILLVLVMKIFGYIFTRPARAAEAASAVPVAEASQTHEEEVAAILVAFSLFKTEMHDRESEVLTIHSIKRAYSPWNSKIHGLTRVPDKK